MSNESSKAATGTLRGVVNRFASLKFLPYRVIRRIGTADISCIFGVKRSELLATPLPDRFSFAEVTAADMRRLVATHPQLFTETHLKELECSTVSCFAIRQQEAIAAFAWLATGHVPADRNHNGDLRAGLSLDMPNDTAFVFNVFVAPEHRGNRLYAALINRLAEPMQSRGVSRYVLTTDATNDSSLRAVRRMGFQYLGRVWIFRLGPFAIAKYPPSPVFGAVQFGRYTGDTKSRRRDTVADEGC